MVGAGRVLASEPQGLAGAAALRVVDTHTHFYDTARPGGVPWPGKDDAFLYRPVWPAEFRKLTAGEGVVGTVVVEASPLLEDNQWLLDLAANDAFLLGVVGNLTPGGERFREHLDRFASQPKFRGIRIGHAALRAGLNSALFLDDLRAFAQRELTLDVNGGPEMLPDIARLTRKIDSLKIVGNHLANVAIDGGAPPVAWREGMAEAHDAAAWLAQDARRVLLVPEPLIRPCFASNARQLAGRSSSDDWWLVEGMPDADCVRQGDPGRAIRYEGPRAPR